MRAAQLHRFATQHEDLIHDLAYDYYGRRIATSSADQKIKIWDQDEATGAWTCSAEWKAHSGSVWKVTWAHPEFGQVLASCSYDRTVIIWEEVEDAQGKKKWIKKRELVDSRESVSDIKFAPRHTGFKLATCSEDGFVRIYEAADIMELSHWNLVEEFEASKGGAKCLAYNPSPFGLTSLVVGSKDSLRVWEYSEQYRKWQSEVALTGHTDAINDVAWAPNLGRSYQLIATASKDGTARIWRLTGERPKYQVTEIARLEDHRAEVWRVEWNVTGTVLASSGDDSSVRLWKANFQGQWKPLTVISGEEDAAPAS